jgi:hypothetical protein
MYGYTDAQWDAAKEEMRAVLIARARDEKTISYTELTREVHAIHFSREEDAAGRGMLSVIVVHREGDKRPGPGFFTLAKKLGRDTSDREKCWVDEFIRVYGNST